MAGHGVPVGRRAFFRAASALLLAVLCLAFTPMRAGTARAADAPGVACAVAKSLVGDALPQRALLVITQARLTPPLDASACAEAFATANEAIQSSLAKSAAATKSLDNRQYEAAITAAKAALALDRENAKAMSVRASAQAAIDGHAGESGLQTLLDQWDSFYERQLKPLGTLLVPFLGVLLVLLVLTRLLVLAPPRWRPLDDLPQRSRRASVLVSGLTGLLTGAALLSVSAADVVELPLSPVDGGIVFGLAVAVGGAAVALAASVLRDRRGVEGEPRRFPSLPVLVGVGAVLVAAATIALALTATTGSQLTAAGDAAGVLGLGILTSGLGATLLAWWLATRIRLTVSVTGSEDKASAADVGSVVALLSELGVDKPQGLEVPRGADVTVLEGAFADLPDNAVLKALKSFIRGVSGVTPWSVTLEGPAQQRAISISRNGRSMRSALICPGQLLPPAKDGGDEPSATKAPATRSPGDVASQVGPDPGITFAASFVLATLAGEHPSMARGLAGATDWRSIGLQYLGTAPGLAIEQKRARLALAVDADPGNLSAALAYRHALDRDSTSYDDLIAYRDWLLQLDTQLGRDPNTSQSGLRLRAIYVRAVIALNAVYARDGAPAGTSLALDQQWVRSALEALNTLLIETRTDDDLGGLSRQFEADVAGVRYLVGMDEKLPEPSGLFGAYNLACSLASRHDIVWSSAATTTQEDDRDAVALLRRARGLPDLSDWMSTDPQLSAFRKRKAYRHGILKAPRTELLAIEPLATFAARLKANGLVHPSLIASADVEELALVLGTTTGVAGHLIDACTLHERLRGLLLVPGDPTEPETRPLARWAVELLAELEKRGLASTAALLECTPAERAAAAEEVVKAVLERCSPGKNEILPDLDTLLVTYVQEWIALVVEAA